MNEDSPGEKSSRFELKAGFTPGWGLGTRFEGSLGGDGNVYDFGTGIGYNFSRHLGIDVGVPFYFTSTPTSIKTNDPNAVSGVGVGSAFGDIKMTFPNALLTYSSAVHVTAPTGSTKKGLSTGHATLNLNNHFEHGWGNFTPYVDAGVGNSLLDTKHFHRPFTTFGYNLQAETGVEFDAGKFSFTGSAYDVAPWGNQTVISRVFRCASGTKCSSTGTTTDRKSYTKTSVASGGASLAKDNGFNGSVEYKPNSRIDFEFDFSRSVPLHLNSYSFGIAMDLSWMLHRPGIR